VKQVNLSFFSVRNSGSIRGCKHMFLLAQSLELKGDRDLFDRQDKLKHGFVVQKTKQCRYLCLALGLAFVPCDSQI